MARRVQASEHVRISIQSQSIALRTCGQPEKDIICKLSAPEMVTCAVYAQSFLAFVCVSVCVRVCVAHAQSLFEKDLRDANVYENDLIVSGEWLSVRFGLCAIAIVRN